MKKLISLILVLIMGLTSFALAEETLSMRVTYMVRMTEVSGVSANGDVVVEVVLDDASLDAAEEHLQMVRDVDRAELLGEEIAMKLGDSKLVACAPIRFTPYTMGMGDVKMTLSTPNAVGVKKGAVVYIVLCIPNLDGTFDYVLTYGVGQGDNTVAFDFTEELLAMMPSEGVLIDFFADVETGA